MSPRFRLRLDPGDRLFPRTRRVAKAAWDVGGRGRYVFVDVLLLALILLFTTGWAVAIARTVSGEEMLLAAGTLTANPFSAEAPPEAAFVLDAIVQELANSSNARGESRKVDVLISHPRDPLRITFPPSIDPSVELEYRPVHNGHVELLAPGGGIPESEPVIHDSTGLVFAPAEPGVWAIIAKRSGVIREVPGIRVIAQVPLIRREDGKIGEFVVGEWPYERGGKPPSEAYAPPRGVVEVTPDNVTLQISEHLMLGDFLTKGQVDVWPKYVLVSSRLLDKIELTLEELGKRGLPVEHVGIISGFRTPTYNAHGGDTEGRASLSRHMYGDAMDLYIDNDRDGRMDDLNRDGEVDVKDARVLAEAAAAVEQEHPTLVGGIGVYSPTGAHAGFVHIDTRGFRARW